MMDMRPLALELLLTGCAVGLAGCAAATVMSTAVDVGKTVVKIPFMLGKGIYEVLTEEPAFAPVVESPALVPPQAPRASVSAVEAVAVTYPVSTGDLPEVRN